MRLRKLGGLRPILVLEGSSDKSALMKWLAPSVYVVPASGKEQVALARKHLSQSELRLCTMLVDCDGLVDPSWLGDKGLIVSDHRDLEADLVDKFPSVEALVYEHLWHLGSTREELAEIATTVRAFAVTLSAHLGVVRDAARACGLSTRIEAVDSGDRRQLRVTDLPRAQLLAAWPSAPSIEKVLGLVGVRVHWNESEMALVVAREAASASKRCRAHRAMRCAHCTPRRFANGHDIVDSLEVGMGALSGDAPPSDVIARELRLSAVAPTGSWVVLDRLRDRGEEIGIVLLSNP